MKVLYLLPLLLAIAVSPRATFAALETTIKTMPKEQIRTIIAKAAKQAALDPALVEAVVQVESNYNVHARSHKGAMGLMQVMPATADTCNIYDPYHRTNNLMGASRCLRELINHFRGNLKLALAAYNAGLGAVRTYGGIPPYPETQAYVKKVLRKYKANRLKNR